MDDQKFGKIHGKFLRKHPEKHTPWFLRTLPSGRNRYRWFMSVLPNLNGRVVLDLCGGYGMFGAYLRAVKNYVFTYICLDGNPHRISHGPKYFHAFDLQSPKFILHNADIALPFNARVFDMVWLFGWCDSFKKNTIIFSEVYRVLKAKGLFFANIAKSSSNPRYHVRFGKDEFDAFMKKHHFKVHRIDNISATDWGILVEKIPYDPS